MYQNYIVPTTYPLDVGFGKDDLVILPQAAYGIDKHKTPQKKLDVISVSNVDVTSSQNGSKIGT